MRIPAPPAMALHAFSHSLSRTRAGILPTNTPARASNSHRVSSPLSETGTLSRISTIIAIPPRWHRRGSALHDLAACVLDCHHGLHHLRLGPPPDPTNRPAPLDRCRTAPARWHARSGRG